MTAEAVHELKERYRRSGVSAGVRLDDAEMRQVIDVLSATGLVTETPPEELRYIEGLLRLPLGSIGTFYVVAAPDASPCPCGRVPTALDVVDFALRHKIHDESLIRDAVVGLRNTFELGDGNRVSACHRCGRDFVSRSYWTSPHYAYA